MSADRGARLWAVGQREDGPAPGPRGALLVGRVFILACLASLVGGCSGESKIRAGDPMRPDVVLVSIDTLRADRLSSYGHHRPTSPFLDELAVEGARFEHARSASPWTLPAHATLLSGQLPSSHQITDDHLRLGASVQVLPEVMKAAGYQTGASVATLYVSRKFGFERGFDFFDDHGITTEAINLSGSVRAEDVLDSALGWLGDVPAGEPVFLFLHFYDVHYQYDPPAPFSTLFDRAPSSQDRRFESYYAHKRRPLTDAQRTHQLAQYDEAIRYVDTELAKLRTAMAKAGRNVRWVVTADHGEEFGERGSWGHAHTLYAEQLRVPLIISGEGLPRGVVVEGVAGIHDIASTVAAWVGGVLPDSDGIDLSPALRGGALPTRPFPAETFRFRTRRISLYEGGRRIEWDLMNDRLELFASETDPLELEDLASGEPRGAAQLAKRAEAVFGRPWLANVAGRVLASRGVVLLNGARKAARVEVGQPFQVLPYDAGIRFALPRSGRSPQGPWRSVGSAKPPKGAPLRFRGGAGPAEILLDDQTKKKLEALGYLQSDD